MHGADAPRGRGHDALVAVLLVGVTVWAYRGMLGHGLHSDDFALVLQNRDLGLGGLLRWLVFGDYGGRPWVYWRPGWSLLFWAVHGVAGASPFAHVLVALVLHVGAVLVVWRVALACVGHAWPAAAAAAWFALHPAHSEAVLWVCAAYNVAPAGMLLTLAGLCIWRHRERRHDGGPWLAVVAIAASLLWKEAAYGFVPLLVFAYAGSWLRRPWDRHAAHAAVATVIVVAVVALHFLFRTGVRPAGGSLAGHAAVFVACAAGFLRAIAPFPGSDGVVVATAAVLGVVAFVAASRTSRFLLVWTACATLPYVLMSAGGRFGWFCHVPLALLLARAASRLAAPGRAAWRGVVAAGAVLATLLLAPASLREAVARHGAESATAARAVDALVADGFTTAERLLVDRTPECLRNGFESAITLRTGRPVLVRSLEALPRPPFVIVVEGEPGLRRDSTLLQFDAAAGRYLRRTVAEVFGDLVPVPLFALAGRHRVVADDAAALALLREGAVDPAGEPVLAAAPAVAVAEPVAARIVEVRTDIRDMGVVVDCARPVLLVVSFPLPVDFTRPPAAIHLDGVPTPVLRANVQFHAVVVPAGRHDVRLVPFGG